MSEPTQTPAPQLFAAPPPERGGFPKVPVLIALGAVLVVLGVVFLMSRGHKTVAPGTVLALDPAAATLPVTDVVMSESTSLSGGKSTFIDGHIHNAGTKTVTGVNVQVLFRNDVAMPRRSRRFPCR